jgi:transcription antitermination factor NusG
VLQLPLFAGYLFCKFGLSGRAAILATPGVVHIVGQGRTPLPVDSRELDAIRVAVNSGQGVIPWPRLEVGRTVRIEEGSLRGLQGVIHRFKGTRHLILNVQLLQRAVAVEVPENCVVPCESQVLSTSALAARFESHGIRN